MEPRSSLSPEALLGQADFVRALARSLMADGNAADDLAQDALTAGLERPPGPAKARAWLASVLRNLLRERQRGAASRAAREQASARAERVPSTAEVLERESARAAVVSAVLALEEPYRTVILLRFYESLAPRAIAAQLGVPVETVHTRTKRALAQLRARLDRDFGPRSAWAALLLPLTRPSPAPSRQGESSPTTAPEKPAMLVPKLVLASLTLVALATTWSELRSSERGLAVATSEATELVAAPVEPAPAPEPEAALPGAREPVPVASLPSSAPFRSAATLRVEVTWADGTPATDVQVRVADVGRPSYAALEKRTTGAGSCSFTGLRAGKVSVQLDRKHRSDSATLVVGEETVLALQIPRGFDIQGRVQDADGAPVGGAEVWVGRAVEPAFLATTSAADGTFTVRSLQPRVGLWVRKDGHAPSLARSFRHPEGAVVTEVFELRGRGASVSGRVLDAEGQPIPGAAVLVDGQGMMREENPDLPAGMTGVVYAVDSLRGAHSGPVWVRTDADGRFAVGGVRPGTVPLGVLAPGSAPWRGSVVAEAGASASTEIRLTRGWSLSGRVLDADGNPAPARLMVHLARVPALLCPSVEVGPDGSFELQDLAPGKLSVWVQGATGAASTTLEGQAGGALTWDAHLGTETGDGPEIDSWDSLSGQ